MRSLQKKTCFEAGARARRSRFWPSRLFLIPVLLASFFGSSGTLVSEDSGRKAREAMGNGAERNSMAAAPESQSPTEGDHGSIAPGGDDSPVKAIQARQAEQKDLAIAEKFSHQEGCAWGREIELFGVVDCVAHVLTVSPDPQKKELRVTADVFWRADLPKLNERADSMWQKALKIELNGGTYPLGQREGRIQLILAKNRSGEYRVKAVRRLKGNEAVEAMTSISRTGENAEWFLKALRGFLQ